MSTIQDSSEDIGYFSSASVDEQEADIVVQDEVDLPILEAILSDIDAKIADYSSIKTLKDNLTVGAVTISLEQRFIINELFVELLQDHRLGIQTIIESVREVQNGRGN